MLTLNLLPPEEKEILRWERINRLIIFYGGIFFIILVIFVLLLFINLIFLNIQLKAIERLVIVEEKSASAQTIKELKEEIATFNQKLEILDQIQSKTKGYSIILEDLAKIIPSGVRLYSFSFDSKTKKIAIEGYAPERNQVISLKESLEKSSEFNSIESPISNLLKQKDINFRFSFTIR